MQFRAAIDEFLRYCANERQLSQHTLQAYAADPADFHKWLPAGRRDLATIMPGIVFTFLVSIAGGEVFGAYLAEFAGNYVSTYAGLASVMIALIFLYAMAAIFVYGGQLNAAIVRAKRGR